MSGTKGAGKQGNKMKEMKSAGGQVRKISEMKSAGRQVARLQNTHLHRPKVESEKQNGCDVHHSDIHTEQGAKEIQGECGALKQQMKYESDGVTCRRARLSVCIFRSAGRAVDCCLGGVEHDIAHEVHFLGRN